MIDDLKQDLTTAMAEDMDNSLTIKEQPKLEINLSK